MRKKFLEVTISLFILIAFVSLISFTQEDWDINDPEFNSNNPTTSAKYRGVVSVDIGDGDVAHELICDFGSMGVWLYDYGTGWHKLSPDDPDWIFGVKFLDADYEILGDFGSKGLWWWDYSDFRGSWTRISPDDAAHGMAVDDDDDGRV